MLIRGRLRPRSLSLQGFSSYLFKPFLGVFSPIHSTGMSSYLSKLMPFCSTISSLKLLRPKLFCAASSSHAGTSCVACNMTIHMSMTGICSLISSPKVSNLKNNSIFENAKITREITNLRLAKSSPEPWPFDHRWKGQRSWWLCPSCHISQYAQCGEHIRRCRWGGRS